MSQNGVEDKNTWEILLIFLRLGLTSFGGPIAHLGYFREEFVNRRKWLSEQSYADLVTLCQLLPGPSSSQVGFAIGFIKSSYSGALAAWLGFTLPSAIGLTIFAYSISNYENLIPIGALHGLKIVTVAIVAQAVWGMARTFCTDTLRISLMVLACFLTLIINAAWSAIVIIMIAGVTGAAVLKPERAKDQSHISLSISKQVAATLLLLFALLFFGLPLLASLTQSHALQLFDAFYRAGSIVFGGGHVILPLLQSSVVDSGWVSNETFLAGYGAAQAIPGPLFTFASFLGASMNQSPNGWMGATLCLVAIFLPSFLFVLGAMPFWDSLRNNVKSKAALSAINASVVGILLAALYQPVWISAIYNSRDFCLALIAFLSLMYWKLPSWLIVIASGLLGWLILG